MVITDRLLLGPGPSNPYPEAIAALGRPLLGHMDPEFLAILDETMARLRTVFRTDNALTLPGQRHRLRRHGGVLRQPGRARRHRDRRRQRRVRRAHVRGRPSLRRRRRARRRGVGARRSTRSACSTPSAQHPDARLVAVVHAETSTGVENDVAPLAALRRHRHAAARRHRHVARRHPGRDRRLGRRRLLLGHAEVPRRAARPLAGHVLARVPSSASRPRALPPQSWYLDLVAARQLRRRRQPRVPPHRAGLDGVLAARRARRAARRGPRDGVGPPPRVGARLQDALPGLGLPPRRARGPPPARAHHGVAARRRRRRHAAQGAARHLRHRGRRRARQVRRQGVAHRSHGPLGPRALGHHAARRARASSWTSRRPSAPACARGSTAARRSTRARRRAPGGSRSCPAGPCRPPGTSAGTAP